MAKQLSCRIDDELDAQVEVFRQANQLSRSQAVRELLRQILTDAEPVSRGWREGYSAAYEETRAAIARAVAELRG
jgi:metal-responsive CopG/Arc/MetJ family transcriptional regulator